MICDLAETYHIYDYKAVPVQLLATLVSGLRDGSRVKTKLSGARAPMDVLLLAAAVDRLSMLLWAQSKDGQKGRNMPPSIVAIINGDEARETSIKQFASGKEFELAWKNANKGG